jgi:hypothetical protein
MSSRVRRVVIAAATKSVSFKSGGYVEMLPGPAGQRVYIATVTGAFRLDPSAGTVTPLTGGGSGPPHLMGVSGNQVVFGGSRTMSVDDLSNIAALSATNSQANFASPSLSSTDRSISVVREGTLHTFRLADYDGVEGLDAFQARAFGDELILTGWVKTANQSRWFIVRVLPTGSFSVAALSVPQFDAGLQGQPMPINPDRSVTIALGTESGLSIRTNTKGTRS